MLLYLCWIEYHKTITQNFKRIQNTIGKKWNYLKIWKTYLNHLMTKVISFYTDKLPTKIGRKDFSFIIKSKANAICTDLCIPWSCQVIPGCSICYRRSGHRSDNDGVFAMLWICLHNHNTHDNCCLASSTA